jgi:hypothetical protein
MLVAVLLRVELLLVLAVSRTSCSVALWTGASTIKRCRWLDPSHGGLDKDQVPERSPEQTQQRW